MRAQSSSAVAARFIERFIKLCNGEITPGQNECNQPYDSEWEREFEWVLAKHIPDFVTLRNQVPFGRFRADYAFECSRSKRIWIVEFDGKAYHDEDSDRKRDAIIFAENPTVQAIVRVDANTGHLEPLETQAMLSKLLPDCFDRQYHPRLDWREQHGVFTTEVFDERHDQEGWMDDGEMLSGAPMVSLQIQIKTRP